MKFLCTTTILKGMLLLCYWYVIIDIESFLKSFKCKLYVKKALHSKSDHGHRCFCFILIIGKRCWTGKDSPQVALGMVDMHLFQATVQRVRCVCLYKKNKQTETIL